MATLEYTVFNRNKKYLRLRGLYSFLTTVFIITLYEYYVRTPPLVVRTRVAVVITITKKPSAGGYLDGAGVLANSAKRNLKNDENELDFIALCGPDASGWGEETFRLIQSAGWKPKLVTTPINVPDIKGKVLRDSIEKSGCCGASELIKLEAFNLDYDRVLLLDSDALIVDQMDDIIAKNETRVAWTMDENLGGGCINGGFLALTPSADDYRSLVNTIIEGDFRSSAGWGGKVGWCYGGQTFQGIIPYYFKFLHDSENGDRFIELNNAKYNYMAFEEDPRVSALDLKSVHFTVCQKPWNCYRGASDRCSLLHTMWWNERNLLEKTLNIPISKVCNNQKDYLPLIK